MSELGKLMRGEPTYDTLLERRIAELEAKNKILMEDSKRLDAIERMQICIYPYTLGLYKGSTHPDGKIVRGNSVRTVVDGFLGTIGNERYAK